MILRLFSTLTTTLFFITFYCQSHSAESIEKLYIPESLSKISQREKAIEFWKDHRCSSNLDREAVRRKFSEITFEYQDLWKQGFDVLNVNTANKNDVFTNVSFVFSSNRERDRYKNDGFEEGRMLEIVEALAHSQITILTIEGSLTPKLGEAIVTLLEGGKEFKKLEMCFDWDYYKAPVYEMIKSIGMAATGKVEELFFYTYSTRCDNAPNYSSTKKSPFDFSGFSVEEGLKKIKKKRELERASSDEYYKKQKQQRQKEEEERKKSIDHAVSLIAKGAAGVAVFVAIYYGIRFL